MAVHKITLDLDIRMRGIKDALQGLGKAFEGAGGGLKKVFQGLPAAGKTLESGGKVLVSAGTALERVMRGLGHMLGGTARGLGGLFAGSGNCDCCCDDGGGRRGGGGGGGLFSSIVGGATGGLVGGLTAGVFGLVVSGIRSVIDTLERLGEAGFQAAKFANPAEARRYQLAWNDLTAAVGRAFTPFLEFGTKFIRLLGDFVLTILPGPEAMKRLRDGLSDLVASMRTTLEDWAPYMKDLWSELWDWFGRLFAGLPTIFANVWDSVQIGVLKVQNWWAILFDSIGAGWRKLSAVFTDGLLRLQILALNAVHKFEEADKLDIFRAHLAAKADIEDTVYGRRSERERKEREDAIAKLGGAIGARGRPDLGFKLPDFGAGLSGWGKVIAGALRGGLKSSVGLAPVPATFLDLASYARKSYEAAYSAGAEAKDPAKDTSDTARAILDLLRRMARDFDAPVVPFAVAGAEAVAGAFR